jgi:hypothetical protein
MEGFDWGEYVAWIVETHGAAAAERICAQRAYADDVTSVERALRRLRARKNLAGGSWGARAIATFGLPNAAAERAKWMGAYHSRFTDLPVPLCLDLVRLWDRPPLSEAPSTRTWLAHASCALRSAVDATPHLRRARASLGQAPPEARAELLLVEAFVASREDPSRVPSLLDEVDPILCEQMPDLDRACLRARLVDQRAYHANKTTGDTSAGEALYLAVPIEHAPPFVLARRANGLAYAKWKQGHRADAAALARESARHAGDGGHLRLRAMALAMLARITGDEDAAARASSVVASLDDEALALRFAPRVS